MTRLTVYNVSIRIFRQRLLLLHVISHRTEPVNGASVDAEHMAIRTRRIVICMLSCVESCRAMTVACKTAYVVKYKKKLRC